MSCRNTIWVHSDKAAVIFEALRNKYLGVIDKDLKAAIDAGLDSALQDGGLPQQLVKDIASQIHTLRAIETASTEPYPSIIRWLQSKLLDRTLTESDYRTDEFVADFDGKPPVAVVDIQPSLYELELAASWAIPQGRLLPLSAKAELLAYIFSSVIRIHPFRDANGRTARFLVQFALKSWDMGLLPIPKVRNDPDWRAALRYAIAGEFQPLASEFINRLEGGREL
jgi:hypothetical protein